MSSAVYAPAQLTLVTLFLEVVEAFWAPPAGLLYHVIEVHRSALGSFGPYKEITAAHYDMARIPEGFHTPDASLGTPMALHGKTLRVRVDGLLERAVTFQGADPYDMQSAAAEINLAAGGLFTAYVSDGHIYFWGAGVGSGRSLEILPTEAAVALGLPIAGPDNIAYGADPRIHLVRGTSSYMFVDRNGSPDFHYRWRLRNILDGGVSAFAGPLQPTPALGVSRPNRVIGFVKLVGIDGNPDVARRVGIHVEFEGKLIEGYAVTGGDRELITDDTGYAEVELVAGTSIRVAIGGTNLVREIRVPSGVASFNLLDPNYGTDDVFTVQRDNTNYATRRN